MDDVWLIGFIAGLLIGIPLGYFITQLLIPKSASVLFERDREGRISSIHYIPVGAKG